MMEMKNGQNKEEMKERKKTPQHLQNTQQMSGSLLRSFISALILSLFSAPSLTEMKF